MQTGPCNGPHKFFMTVKHWKYYDLGNWDIISWHQITILTSPSAKYCSLFKVWGWWMLKQGVAQKDGKSQSTRAPVTLALWYCTVFYTGVVHANMYRLEAYNPITFLHKDSSMNTRLWWCEKEITNNLTRSAIEWLKFDNNSCTQY
jgi:hypothetical protein